MTHNEKRASWQKEMAYTSICGLLYGGTNTIVGHPFDTVKTKMQAQSQHMEKSAKYVETIKNVYRQEGALGFYRGWAPPFLGSIIFRSVQFSVFEACYTKWENDSTMRQTIPFTPGTEWRVLAAGVISGSVRSAIECPFEYAKVKG